MDRNALAELLQALESRRDAEERRREERYTALIERVMKIVPGTITMKKVVALEDEVALGIKEDSGVVLRLNRAVDEAEKEAVGLEEGEEDSSRDSGVVLRLNRAVDEAEKEAVGLEEGEEDSSRIMETMILAALVGLEAEEEDLEVVQVMTVVKEEDEEDLAAEDLEVIYVPPPPPEEEDTIFAHYETGINFNKYDDILVDVSGNAPLAIMTFDEAGLCDTLNKNISKSGYVKPTPVQKHGIPIVLGGCDLMACAQTGSGKTAAFLLPILQQLMKDGVAASKFSELQEPEAIIVAPTRELINQIYLEARKFAYGTCVRPVVVYGGISTGYTIREVLRGCNVLCGTPGRLMDIIGRGKGGSSSCCSCVGRYRDLVNVLMVHSCKSIGTKTCVRPVVVYGGISTGYTIREVLKGCNVLCGTPGRLMDIIGRGKVGLRKLRYLVLDEADRMLDMGFEPEMRRLVASPGMPPNEERQTLLFSATYPEDIQKLAADFLKPGYIFLAVGQVGGACSDVEQNVLQVTQYSKRDKLVEMLQTTGTERTMVFVETKRKADFIATFLCQEKIPTTSIHGDREQREREQALGDFRTGKCPVLVATSVAARGLDIEHVQHVVNFDLPSSIDEYVHRIGRTGRCGNTGKAISFFDPESDTPIARSLVKVLSDKTIYIEKYRNYVHVNVLKDADRTLLRCWLSSGYTGVFYDLFKDREQREREQALGDFRTGKCPVLVATSVAARGLDIEHVQHVVNFDLPSSIDEYVHRIGRTGRCGNTGKAISFFDPESDTPIARSLVKVLSDAKQEVPAWLEEVAFSAHGTTGFNPRGNVFASVDSRKVCVLT
ncbi:UNVERIFIED_CONTAM: hypothetical protein FKN15_020490 [Acipenser sinensis]